MAIRDLLRNLADKLLGTSYARSDEGSTIKGVSSDAYEHGYMPWTTINQSREELYSDMDSIDDTVPEGSRAMDVLADNAVNSIGGGVSAFKITYEEGFVSTAKRQIIEDMLKRVQLATKAYAIARDALKKGDNFQQIVISSKMRIERLMYMPPDSMRRNEDDHGLLKMGSKQGEWAFEQYDPGTTKFIAGFLPWQIYHLRWNRSGSSKYGRALLKSARYTWKKWVALQEALIINWLTRAFVRLMFKLDATGKTPVQAQDMARKFISGLERREVTSQESGIERMSVAKDIAMTSGYINVGGEWKEAQNDVKVLDTSNSGFWNITAIEYMRNKFIAATGVPKAHLGLEQDINAKATLEWQDERFSRTVRRIQMMMSELIDHMIKLELVLHDIEPENVQYAIVWDSPSTTDEVNRSQALRNNAEAADKLINRRLVDPEWFSKKVLGLSNSEYAAVQKRLEEEPPEPSNGRNGDGQVVQKKQAVKVR